MAAQESFFQETTKPANIHEITAKIKCFVNKHVECGSRIALVTSGGTTVPLEGSTVRFIDNFSIGTRGSASAEYFLEHEYAVIFLHRLRSLEPFTRHLPQHQLLEVLQLTTDGTLQVKQDQNDQLLSVVQKYQDVYRQGRLLSLDFTTLVDYLHLLRACAQILAAAGNQALLYLAAAVSDFYIPRDKMPQHKIQSSEGPLQLSLELVPKMLEALVKHWVTRAFVVSFKLETDPSLLISKAKKALEKYQHQIVIGNVLDTRKRKVVMISKTDEQWIRLNQTDLQNGVEIESKIVESLVHIHNSFCDNS